MRGNQIQLPPQKKRKKEKKKEGNPHIGFQHTIKKLRRGNIEPWEATQ